MRHSAVSIQRDGSIASLGVLAGLIALLISSACGKTTPTSPAAPPAAATTPPGTVTQPGVQFTTSGEVIDLLTSSGVAGVAIAGADLTGGATDDSGAFTLTSSESMDTARTVTISGADVVTRQTAIRVPGSSVT